MNLDQLKWLIRTGRQYLCDSTLRVDAGSADASRPSVALVPSSLTAWQKSLLQEQQQYQKRARPRFPNSEQWLWTDRSLQQASDWACARYKASLFHRDTTVIDACCGAGADLVALALEHQVMGIDRDLAMLLLAQSNLNAHGLQAELLQAELPGCLSSLERCCLHIDPDRRQGATRDTRTIHGEAFSPPLGDCVELGSKSQACLIKLAPATEVDIDGDWSRCWLGTPRHCPQQLLMRGELTYAFVPGLRACVLVGETPHVFTADDSVSCQRSDRALEYIYDLHPALYASGLASAFAAEHGLQALIQSAGYMTSRDECHSPWVQGYRVLEEMSWDERRVRKWLRQHHAGLVEVKTRHVPLNANQLQVQLSRPTTADSVPLTLLLYSAGKSIKVVIASVITEGG